MRKMSDNKFEIGLFAPNVWGGLSKTLAEQRWEATWENNVALAHQAEEAGLEFILPIAQWLGHNGQAETDGAMFETVTWAAGILAETERITVFATVHTPFVNPVFAAKQFVTIDHIGSGRFGLNIVSGSNPPEFAMFGVELLEHDERYAYTEEWVTILKRLWAEHEPFDFDGKYFQLKGVYGEPKPYGDERPTLISAGSSPAGRSFAVRHADCLFMFIGDPTKLADELKSIRASVEDRRVPVYGSAHLLCKPTRKEAEEYFQHVVHEKGDMQAVEYMKKAVFGETKSVPPGMLEKMVERMIGGGGTFPLKGDPDDVANALKMLSDAGMDGVAIAMVNYLEDLPILRDEILPRLERMGLRGAAVPAGASA
jgi:alkanesulfonate monooxygenase SsuD/methylene tetrahydromethanopterin reductase-like flavin-dependent oxidoreductase (luciferase family)